MNTLRFRSPVRSTLLVTLVTTLITALSTLSQGRADDSRGQAGTHFFETHVRPLLISRCYSCHSSQAGKVKGGLALDARQGWQRGGDSGSAIEPGDADASLLIRAVRYDDPELQMPPDRALPQHEIAALEQWVRLGAPDPRTEDRDAPAAVSPPATDPADPIAGRTHWAYRPLDVSSPIDMPENDWASSPIDRYIAAGLQAAGLSPAADADRHTLVRRLFIQLTGLPPTP
ncbi:MAG: DUF1549 domain-containing protein, partial [Planctomycetales bacterium]|nr:DUF1549 domain-containing protein [Planctomycetales bacterium]